MADKLQPVPPSGGFLEIGNLGNIRSNDTIVVRVPPSGGSLEIGNSFSRTGGAMGWMVPPSGGSLEIGNNH